MNNAALKAQVADLISNIPMNRFTLCPDDLDCCALPSIPSTARGAACSKLTCPKSPQEFDWRTICVAVRT